jgi:hypothetical protein
MQQLGIAPPSAWSIAIRLLLAFLLGLPVGLMYFFVGPPPNFASWRYGLPIAILLAAMLLSILLDPTVRNGAITPKIIVVIGILLLLLAVTIVGSVVIPLEALLNFATAIAILMPFFVGLAAAFTVGSSGGWRLALGSALTAWLGAGIHIVIIAILGYFAYEQTTPGGDAGIGLPFTIIGVIIGFALAAIGGLLGWYLHSWILGGPPITQASA